MADGTVANVAMQRYWNEVSGPRWVKLGGLQEARNIEIAELLLAEGRPVRGERVLDVGCGTGATLLPFAAAIGPEGHATGIDISEPMLGAARQQIKKSGLKNVTLLLADAQVYPLPSVSFDLLISRFGVMFFADPFAAFRNLISAVKPGGRLCMAVWAPITDNTHWKIPYEIAVRRAGPPADVSPHTPGPLAFSDPDYLRRILADAGFAEIRIEPRTFHVHGESAATMGEHATMMGPAARLLDEKQADDATRQAVIAETIGAYAPYANTSGELRLPGTVLLAAARRPG
jgi:ubiquinone/menaquinone biosynthesis C-methylase UbiE